MKIIQLAVVLALFTTSLTAFGKKEEDIELAGVQFGMTAKDIFALAKRKGRKLVGPSKGILDIETQVQCTEYRVDKSRSLSGTYGISRQAFLIINNKLIGVELHFKTSSSFKKFLRNLKELGYETQDEKLYVGALKTGDLKGSRVEVRVSKFKGGNKGKRWKYIVMVRCLEVLGKGVTLETIQKAAGQQNNNRTKQQKKTLKGLDSLL